MLATVVEISRRVPENTAELTELEKLRRENARLRRDAADLQVEVEALKCYRATSSLDPLTGLPNRRAVEQRLAEELSRHRRTRAAVSVVVFDVDAFHRINETLGHTAGDRLLQSLGKFLQRLARDYDVVGRVGADRFAVVLPEADAAACFKFVKRFRAGWEGPVAATIAIGCATAKPDSVADSLLQDALADLATRRFVAALVSDEPMPLESAVPVDVVDATLESVDTLLVER